jgi:hypothetical protein
MRKNLLPILAGCLLCIQTTAQMITKSLPAKRTSAPIRIDGKIDEAAWKEAVPATDFVEWRPNFGAIENTSTKTEVYLLYDNTAVYVAGYCHEKKDSISRELVGRDQIGVNDYIGVIFDTYFDKINAVGFYVTPLGEQYDAKYSNTAGEDDTWNAVWDSEAQVVADGWTFEMKIPYSALRFVSKDNQSWGLNITRNRKKIGRQYMWSPTDPKLNGFINQEGSWTGIEKIHAPLRLSFSPYFSTYVNHFPANTPDVKNWTSSVNGGMDVKYGISDAFTLDMTLIPDFGQVQSDNQILNLSPFEVKYNENRPFFTEGTELFNKGNLFYSRRIGSQPIHIYDVEDTTGSFSGHIQQGEQFIKNPTESKLINATKISGRTKKGFGLGVFNAITNPMYAEIEDIGTKSSRKVQTNPLTNYNIVVFDQTLKNNSAVSFINTNTWRSGNDYDANVSAAVYDFNNKKNTYNLNGKFALSQLYYPGKNVTGYSHTVNFSKSGNWSYQIGEEVADDKYNINDMGILFNNNYVDHYFWSAYRWLKPKKLYNRIQVNYNAYYSLLYKKLLGQKVNSKFQIFTTNVNANAQLKNLWSVGMFIGYIPGGNDFYEPRVTGWSFRATQRVQLNPWFETDATKKYYVSFNYFVGIRKQFKSRNNEFNFSHRYRFSDKFSLRQDLNYNPFTNDAGFYTIYNGDIIFSRRNRMTVENILSAKYSFNNKSGLTLRARHYWSKVEHKQFYDLQENGNLLPTHYDQDSIGFNHRSINFFNIDMVYTLQFAPGSFINIVWKNAIFNVGDKVKYTYFKNLDRTVSSPQNNNLSFKIIYYLDYLKLKGKH